MNQYDVLSEASWNALEETWPWVMAKAFQEQKTMSAHNDNDQEFRVLVQSLMRQGWYRMRQDSASTKRQWGFRQGHTLENPIQECWVVANSEIEAMRIMWNMVSTKRVEKQLVSH